MSLINIMQSRRGLERWLSDVVLVTPDIRHCWPGRGHMTGSNLRDIVAGADGVPSETIPFAAGPVIDGQVAVAADYGTSPTTRVYDMGLGVANADTDWSIAAWVNWDGRLASSSGAIVGRGYLQVNRGLGLYVGTNGAVRFQVRDGANTANSGADGTALTVGRWYLLTGTWDMATKTSRLYISGELSEPPVTNEDITTIVAANSWVAGARISGKTPGFYFGGSIGPVAVYQRRLSDEEIKWHYETAVKGI